MRHIKLLSIIIMMAGLMACEKIIPYDDIAPEPLLVVNGLQHVGQPAYLCVEKSSFYINNETDFRVKDVHADLYVNGVFKESLQVRDSLIMETYSIWGEDPDSMQTVERLRCAFNYCEGTYILQEGDQLRFEVSSSEFEETAIAETTMPYAPTVISFDTVRTEGNADDYDGKVIYFSLKIDDPTGKDFYNLFPQQGLDGFNSNDPVFNDFMNIVHVDDLFGQSDYYARGAYNLFNDAYFDGKQYDVSLNYHLYSAGYPEPFVLDVSRVDEGFYQYRKSLNLYQTNDEGLMALFTEPTQVYSNVKNGVGVVCSQSLSISFTIDLTEE